MKKLALAAVLLMLFSFCSGCSKDESQAEECCASLITQETIVF